MKTTIAALVLGTLLGWGTVSSAQPVGYVTKKVLRFNGSEVEGSLPTVGQNWLVAAEKIRFPSLIVYRYDFVPEMDRTIDNL